MSKVLREKKSITPKTVSDIPTMTKLLIRQRDIVLIVI